MAQARAWVTAESSRALLARQRAADGPAGSAARWSTLWRLVGSARETADERGWSMLAATLTDEQRERLERLLHVPAGHRVTDLERLRMAPVDPSIRA